MGKNITSIPNSKILNNNLGCENTTDKENYSPNAEHAFWSMIEDPEIVECFLNLPLEDCYLNLPNQIEDEHPLDMEVIKERQQADEVLLKRVKAYPNQYLTKQLATVTDILCHVKEGEDPKTQLRIALSQDMIEPTVKWFHKVTGHPGSKKLHLTLNQ